MLTNKWSFKSPTSLVFGNGVANNLGGCMEKLGINKAILITDETILNLDSTKNALKMAKESCGVDFVIFSKVEPEPPVENVYESLKLYADNGCNGIVGFGGGSAMDVAKAVAMLVTNEGKYEDYVGIDKVPKKCAPLILMPTTSGTGSEVSIFSIMLVNGVKMGVVDENITANIAIVDPLLTVSVPRKVTAATGLDALCHHLESFLSVNFSPMQAAMCLDSITVIAKYLRKAVANGNNEEARYHMAYASTMGGYCSNLSEGAAANHGLAFALGAKYHISHGLANAMLLKHVLPVIGLAELEKMRQIGEAFGVDLKGLADREALDDTVKAIAALVADIGCDIPLSLLGVKEEDINELVVETNKQTRVMGHSTYALSSAEIREIFQAALAE